MNDFEKINSFMEGELGTSEEQSLFNEMAVNESLRGEFKNLMAISTIVKNNKNAFSKNEKTKKAVFAALGLSIPVADAVTTGVASTGAGATVGYGIKSLLATGLLSAIATAILLYSFGGFDQSRSFNNNSNDYAYNRFVLDAPKPEKVETPIVFSRDISSSQSVYKAMYFNSLSENKELRNQLNERELIISKQNEEVKTLYAENSELTKSFNKAKGDYSQLNSAYISQASQIETLNSKLTDFQNNNEAINLSPKLELEQASHSSLSSSRERSWSAEWKGSQTFNSNATEIANNDVSQFNNNSLSVLYNFESGFSVGADLRQETFFLEFTGEDVNNVTYLYRQEPNFTTLSLLGRYTYDMSETLNPFAQITFGGNKIGVVGRIMGGFMYSPYQNLNLILGVEYNSMSFQYQGDRFNSGKVGINYGVSFTF